MWEHLGRMSVAAALTRLWLPLLALQLVLDALLGDHFLLVNSWRLAQAYAYKISGQDWWAVYGTHFMAGQAYLGEAALYLGGLLALLPPLLWAGLLLGFARLLRHAREADRQDQA